MVFWRLIGTFRASIIWQNSTLGGDEPCPKISCPSHSLSIKAKVINSDMDVRFENIYISSLCLVEMQEILKFLCWDEYVWSLKWCCHKEEKEQKSLSITQNVWGQYLAIVWLFKGFLNSLYLFLQMWRPFVTFACGSVNALLLDLDIPLRVQEMSEQAEIEYLFLKRPSFSR